MFKLTAALNPRPHTLNHPPDTRATSSLARELFLDNLVVRIHFIVEIIWWTGLALWEVEFPLSSSLVSTFLNTLTTPRDTFRKPSLIRLKPSQISPYGPNAKRQTLRPGRIWALRAP